jgi:transcriptional regulator with XRE-family HTH domain
MTEEKTNTRTQIASRRQQVAEMYLRGLYQSDIAEKLGVDQSTISRDLSELRKEWLERSINHIDQKKAIELAKLDRLEVTYWEAWERSRENAEVETTEQIGKRGKDEGGIIPERIRKTKRVEGQSGNPAFLEGVLKCIVQRCKILGIEAPVKQDLTTNGKELPAATVNVYIPNNGRDPDTN